MGRWTAAPATWTYFVLDNLGSVAVLTDGSGSVTKRLSYDAWGKPRNPNGTDAACGSISSPTTRGFTNQEQIASLCLVNLNARLYDPTIGKFQAADSVVPYPYNDQSYNRYAYVLNNPLSLIDPSGFFPSDYTETITVTGTGAPVGLGGDFLPSFGGRFSSITFFAVQITPLSQVESLKNIGTGSRSDHSLPVTYNATPGGVFKQPDASAAAVDAVLATEDTVVDNSDAQASDAWAATGGAADTVAPGRTETVTVVGHRDTNWSGTFASYVNGTRAEHFPYLNEAKTWGSGNAAVSDLLTGVFALTGAEGLVKGTVGLFSRDVAEAGTTTLYRAVMNPEADSIQASGAFTNPAGIETKYFSTSLEGAQSYASQASRAFGDGPFSIVQTSIPTSSITPDMVVSVDRGIQTVVVPTADLTKLSAPVFVP